MLSTARVQVNFGASSFMVNPPGDRHQYTKLTRPSYTAVLSLYVRANVVLVAYDRYDRPYDLANLGLLGVLKEQPTLTVVDMVNDTPRRG